MKTISHKFLCSQLCRVTNSSGKQWRSSPLNKQNSTKFQRQNQNPTHLSIPAITLNLMIIELNRCVNQGRIWPARSLLLGMLKNSAWLSDSGCSLHFCPSKEQNLSPFRLSKFWIGLNREKINIVPKFSFYNTKYNCMYSKSGKRGQISAKPGHKMWTNTVKKTIFSRSHYSKMSLAHKKKQEWISCTSWFYSQLMMFPYLDRKCLNHIFTARKKK